MSRDRNSHEAGSPLRMRDTFYSAVFGELLLQAKHDGPLMGANFWAWGGEGRPRRARARGEPLEGIHCWHPPDALLGDPPHEAAGWYSVYETDHSTHALLLNFSRQIDEIEPRTS